MEAERQSPEATFALLGNELRVSILRALGETPDEPVAVSELRKRVGERDSGKFNYHLGKLAGQFVRRTDDGYQLTIAGHRIVGAILAGTYTTDATLSPVEVDSPCPLCGGRLVAEYADEQARVHCTDCEEWANVVANATVQNMVPEGLLGRVTAVASSLSTVMMPVGAVLGAPPRRSSASWP